MAVNAKTADARAARRFHRGRPLSGPDRLSIDPDTRELQLGVCRDLALALISIGLEARTQFNPAVHEIPTLFVDLSKPAAMSTEKRRELVTAVMVREGWSADPDHNGARTFYEAGHGVHQATGAHIALIIKFGFSQATESTTGGK